MSDKHKIKPFASDDNLKTLGELLSNDTSRKIMFHLMNSEMYTNEIATKLDIRVSLVIHHLKKMEDLNLVQITEKKIKRKGGKHRFFKIDSNIFVTVNKTKKEVEDTGLLKKIFRNGIKFSAIGIVAILSAVIKVPNSHIVNYPVPFGMEPVQTESHFLLLPLSVIIIGLIIERIWFGLKKRKRG